MIEFAWHEVKTTLFTSLDGRSFAASDNAARKVSLFVQVVTRTDAVVTRPPPTTANLG
jgi:hypothetical protein